MMRKYHIIRQITTVRFDQFYEAKNADEAYRMFMAGESPTEERENTYRHEVDIVYDELGNKLAEYSDSYARNER